MSKSQSSNVDGRCDGDWDECQGSEGRNKLPRQSEGRLCRKSTSPVATIHKPLRASENIWGT